MIGVAEDIDGDAVLDRRVVEPAVARPNAGEREEHDEGQKHQSLHRPSASASRPRHQKVFGGPNPGGRGFQSPRKLRLRVAQWRALPVLGSSPSTWISRLRRTRTGLKPSQALVEPGQKAR